MEQVDPRWRKASYSGNGANCVEVADTASAVLIRDTKDRGTGPVLRVGPDVWKQFTATLRLSRTESRPPVATAPSHADVRRGW
jgi:hypothetical protein